MDAEVVFYTDQTMSVAAGRAGESPGMWQLKKTSKEALNSGVTSILHYRNFQKSKPAKNKKCCVRNQHSLH